MNSQVWRAESYHPRYWQERPNRVFLILTMVLILWVETPLRRG